MSAALHRKMPTQSFRTDSLVHEVAGQPVRAPIALGRYVRYVTRC